MDKSNCRILEDNEVMIRLLAITAIACVLLFAACNKGDDSASSTADTQVAKESAPKVTAAEAAAAGEASAPTEKSTEASSVTLADGTQAKVIAASLLDSDPKANAGRVAIKGEVVQVFADKGTFVLKDCAKDEDCKTEDYCSCCSEAQMPIKLEMDQYAGQLPEAKQDVLVIADVNPTEAGYTRAVLEDRLADKAILTRKP